MYHGNYLKLQYMMSECSSNTIVNTEHKMTKFLRNNCITNPYLIVKGQYVCSPYPVPDETL